MQEKIEIIKKAYEIMAAGMIWVFGWATYYLYQVSKWQQFKITMFILNVCCAFFCGWLVGQFIPWDPAYRDWLIAIAWFSTYPILDLLEKYWAKFFIKKIIWKQNDGDNN